MRIVLVAAILLVVVYAVTQSRKNDLAERERAERESAEKMYQRQDARVAAQRKDAYDAAKAARMRALDANAEERARIQREYPDAWHRLAGKAGGSLEGCIVNARSQPGAGSGTVLTLPARCVEEAS